MRKSLFFFLALPLLAVAFWQTEAQAAGGYKIIVNSGNPTTSLSKGQVSSYLLKKKSRWENNVPVDPVDLEAGSDVRAAMSEEIHGRSVSSIKNYWQRQIFSGRGTPPREVKSDSAVIDFVRDNAGGIGYVSPSTRLDGVKEVRIVD
ncbi:MAG: hypothetical protein MI919_15640 [Holophagales bacterium]|nr:hypothetical protein [Holophagales bacterium]